MKKLLFASVTMACVTTIKGQNPYVIIDTASKNSKDAIHLNNTLLKQGRFSHTTSKGDIYVLPYDNMPCLVPNMQQTAPMPGSIQRVPESRMPNAIPRRQIIPQNKK